MKALKFIFFLSLVFSFSCTDLFENSNETNEERLPLVDRVEIEYLFDNVDYLLKDKNPPPNTSPTELIEGVEHYAMFSSVGGDTEQTDNSYYIDFQGNEVLGKTMNGWIDLDFYKEWGGRWKLNLKLDVQVEFSSFVNGDVSQKFKLESNGLYHINFQNDDADLAPSLLKENVCNNTVNLFYEEDNRNYKTNLFTRGCNDRAYLKVKVYYKPI